MDTTRFIYGPEEGAALSDFDPKFTGGFRGEDEARNWRARGGRSGTSSRPTVADSRAAVASAVAAKLKFLHDEYPRLGREQEEELVKARETLEGEAAGG